MVPAHILEAATAKLPASLPAVAVSPSPQLAQLPGAGAALASWWGNAPPTALQRVTSSRATSPDEQIRQFFGEKGVGYHLPVAALANDQVWNDTYPQPYVGPLSYDNAGTAGPLETHEMRWLYRELYRREPSIRSAIKGKADAVACLDVSVIPQDPHSDNDCEAAEFVKWTVENTLMGWDGLIVQLVTHALIDGWCVLEKVLRPVAPERHRRYAGMWGLYHCRPLDTMWLRLQTDQFRNVLNVVNTVRGQEFYSADKFLLFSYSSLLNNPFGQSDLRACVRACGLIQDAYQLWYLALKQFGLPYLHGKVDQPTMRAAMEEALAELRAGGFAVTGAKDEIELLSLASATSFSAFEANIRAMREDNYLSIRGAYLPFLEGVGGPDAHGNTAISKVASDTNTDLLAKAVARVLTHQLVPWLVRDNFPVGTGYPTITLGGTSWEEVRASLDVAITAADKFDIELSKDQVYKRINWAPPDGDDDRINFTQILTAREMAEAQVQMQVQAQQAQMQAQLQQQAQAQQAAQQPPAQAPSQQPGDGFEMTPPQEGQAQGGEQFEMGAPAQMSAEVQSRLDAAAEETNTAPTKAQKETGNYKKGRFNWKGLTVAIENPKGSIRSGVAKDGTKWSVTMKDHYGYIARTKSEADGDAVDVFLSEDDLDSEIVFVINQNKPSGRFDEHKCVLGATNAEDAKRIYLRNYSKGWTGFGSITEFTLPQFKAWLADGDTGSPVRHSASVHFADAPQGIESVLDELLNELMGAA